MSCGPTAARARYVARGTDVQAQAIFAGLRPAELGAAWGYESEARWGTLHTAAGPTPVPSEQGAYQDYYTQFAAALRGEARVPGARARGGAHARGARRGPRQRYGEPGRACSRRHRIGGRLWVARQAWITSCAGSLRPPSDEGVSANDDPTYLAGATPALPRPMVRRR